MDGVGNRLRARGRELGLSDVEVARRLGFSQSRYANYINDEREPDLATFVRICRLLETNPDEILGYDDPPPPAAEEDRLRQRIAAASRAMDLETLRTAAIVMDALCAARSPG
ncbi:helix-turn-helix domain-containing protein [Limobrevibacterium gyesilva]|uniref:Helix-turn-helix domain-containing protein n=1 Tax=Limobrevibacterium gyesilva TaxID=2991712 RepID=A0AA41YMK5_9PROT|nr:helix-turn-helix transcriptional regulator [Limobrevibacterium gyesilva]MCW3476274.1 helix-turn-helix domain-containing protein [Limobrevibacterium gyesilva]